MNRAPRRGSAIARVLDTVDRLLDRLVRAAQWLCLPLALLLFLQWPLRELVQQGSRETNDAAQVLFALFIAVAMTAATRARTHLASDVLASRLSPALRHRLGQAVVLAGVLPWALFVFASGAPSMWQSLQQLERFPETFNPGYFVIRLAGGLLVLALALQALLDLVRGFADDTDAVDSVEGERRGTVQHDAPR